MKFSSVTAALIAILLSADSVCAASIPEVKSAVLTDVHNKVFKRDFADPARETWSEPVVAKMGDVLHEGMQVGTGNESWAQISWTDVATRTWENTVVMISPGRKLVHLLDGEMLLQLNKNRKDMADYLIWTKVLQVRMRGTTVLVQSSGEFSRVSVLEGSADVTNRLDNSVINLRPGVVYEVRTGAPPESLPPTAARPGAEADWQQYWSDVMPGSSPPPKITRSNPIHTSPTQHQGSKHGTGSNTASTPQTTTTATQPPSRSPSANDFEKFKRRVMNEVKSPGDIEPIKQQMMKEGWTPADMERLKQMLKDAGWQHPQQEWQKHHKNWKGLHETESKFLPVAYESSVSDTSELAPVNCEVKPKIDLATADSTIKDVANICSWNAPPISVFRTTQSATNLYLADAESLMNHPLVLGFSEKLESLPLVNASLTKYLPIARGALGPSSIQTRNVIFTQSAQVLAPPATPGFKTGSQMGYKYSMPIPTRPRTTTRAEAI